MKKLAICCLVLAVAVMFVPKSQANPRCISLQDYCDLTNFDTSNIGGQTGTELIGDWLWDCVSTSTYTAGNGGAKLKFGTRPVYSNGVAFFYTSNWTLTKANHLGDINFSAGLSGGLAFAIQNEPWSQSAGTCFAAKTNKPSLMQKLAR